MGKNVVLEDALAKALTKLKLAQQTIYSDPEQSYNIVCSATRNLDEAAIALYRMAGGKVKT